MAVFRGGSVIFSVWIYQASFLYALDKKNPRSRGTITTKILILKVALNNLNLKKKT